MTSLVDKTSYITSGTTVRRRDVHALRKKAVGARSIEARRTFQPVRGGSRFVGEKEGALWRTHNRFGRDENNARLRALEQLGAETKQPGKKKGEIGHVAMAIARLMLRRRGPADGRLDPTLRYIAQETRHSVSAVEVGVAELEAAGFCWHIRRCEPVEDPEPGGQYVKQASNAYVLALKGRLLQLVCKILRRPMPDQQARLVADRADRGRSSRQSADRPAAAPTWSAEDQEKFLAELRSCDGAIPQNGNNPALKG